MQYYGYPVELIIYYMVTFLTDYGMEKDLYTNSTKYGMWDITALMDMLQKRSLMVYHILVISWDGQSLKELFSTRSQINLF